MKFTLQAVAFALVMVCGHGAHAGDEEEAKEAFQDGLARFEGAEYEEAAASFRRANELNPTWKILYNIAQCEAALKHYGLALEAFERYLSEGGDDIAKDREDEVLAEVGRLARKVGTVEVKAPDGVRIEIDQVERGTTPVYAGIRVPAGVVHIVRLFEGGQEAVVKEVKLGSGQTVAIDFDAESDGASMPGGPAEIGEDDQDGLNPVFFWCGLGATVAFGGTTVALHFATDSKLDDIRSDPDSNGLRDEGESMQTAGIVFLSLTAAAAVTTGVLAFFTDFSAYTEKERSVAFQPYLDAGGGGLRLGGRF